MQGRPIVVAVVCSFAAALALVTVEAEMSGFDLAVGGPAAPRSHPGGGPAVETSPPPDTSGSDQAAAAGTQAVGDGIDSSVDSSAQSTNPGSSGGLDPSTVTQLLPVPLPVGH